MYLTREEKEMLDGKYGDAIQKSMELLIGLGECYDAEKMIPVTSAHLLASPSILLKGGCSFVREMADKGGKFAIFTTVNPSEIDPRFWNHTDIGISGEYFSEQTALTNTLTKMGAFLTNSCTPYLVGHVPRLGQHVAWSESSAEIFGSSKDRYYNLTVS